MRYVRRGDWDIEAARRQGCGCTGRGYRCVCLRVPCVCCAVERKIATWLAWLLPLAPSNTRNRRNKGPAPRTFGRKGHALRNIRNPVGWGHDFLSWSSGVFQLAARDRRLKNGTAWSLVGSSFGAVLESWREMAAGRPVARLEGRTAPVSSWSTRAQQGGCFPLMLVPAVSLGPGRRLSE